MKNENKINIISEEKLKIPISIDIGGTLTKVGLLFEKTNKSLYEYLSNVKLAYSEIVENDKFFLFLGRFQTHDFKEEIAPLLIELKKYINIEQIEATGGGAFKFSDLMQKNYNIKFNKHDELSTLVHGYVYMNNFNSFYEVKNFDSSDRIPADDLTFPHLSVNIGSGVSILKVTSKNQFERVGGTLMGGATLIGLCKLIIGIDSYNEILDLASKGNYENVDLTVKDIYKTGKIGFPENAVASSFGKVHEFTHSHLKEKLKKEDIALSLLTMICFHITQLGIIYAHKNNIKKIYYFGNFTRRGSRATFALAQCSKFWDKDINVRFNYFDGFLGSIGAILEKEKEINN